MTTRDPDPKMRLYVSNDPEETGKIRKAFLAMGGKDDDDENGDCLAIMLPADISARFGVPYLPDMMANFGEYSAASCDLRGWKAARPEDFSVRLRWQDDDGQIRNCLAIPERSLPLWLDELGPDGLAGLLKAVAAIRQWFREWFADEKKCTGDLATMLEVAYQIDLKDTLDRLDALLARLDRLSGAVPRDAGKRRPAAPMEDAGPTVRFARFLSDDDARRFGLECGTLYNLEEVTRDPLSGEEYGVIRIAGVPHSVSMARLEVVS